MIPRRVCLKGFLCYKEEQIVEFDSNTSVWMLSGSNGSGKSSIFDAVTYALFGHHRGGGQQAVELINKDCNGLEVDLDVLLEGKMYRFRRTLKRDLRGGARGTQQILRLKSSASTIAQNIHSEKSSKGDWEPVEDTGGKREFDSWISDNIGLNYETFTSSVLLLQGKAEKLLDSRPEGRREVLARIVDLNRFERLHKAADELRREMEAGLKALQNRLDAIPPVKAEEIVEADNRILEAETARAAARAEVERLQALEIHARNFIQQQNRLVEVRQRLQRAQQVLSNAAQIETQARRHKELKEVYPLLKEIMSLRGQAQDAEKKTTTFTGIQQQLQQDRDSCEDSLKQAREKKNSLQHRISQDDLRIHKLQAQLRESASLVAKLDEYEKQEAECQRLRQDLTRLPADPAAEVAHARRVWEELDKVARTLPRLMHFADTRKSLREVMERLRLTREQQSTIRKRGETLSGQVILFKAQLEELRAQLHTATDVSTTARTLLESANLALANLSDLDGAKVCRHCGQALTAAHMVEEKRRRGKEVSDCEARTHKALEERERAFNAHRLCEEQVREVDRLTQEARGEYREVTGQLRQSEAEVDRLRETCASAWQDLPEVWRRQGQKSVGNEESGQSGQSGQKPKVTSSKPMAPVHLMEPEAAVEPVGQLTTEPFTLKPVEPLEQPLWLLTPFPTSAEVDEIRARAKGVSAAQSSLERAEKVLQDFDRLQVQLRTTQDTLIRLLADLPTDRTSLRQTYAGLILEDKTTFNSRDDNRKALRGVEADLEKLDTKRNELLQKLNGNEVNLREQKLVIENSKRGVENQLKQLPSSWLPEAQSQRLGIKELYLLQKEQTEIEESGVLGQALELEQARVGIETLKQDLAQREAEIQTFPPEAREGIAPVRDRLSAARSTDQSCDVALANAREERARLQGYVEARQSCAAEYLDLEHELISQRLLAELLGRDRLQLYLVRQAERQVIEYANSVLDRLSGGELYLRLVGEASPEGTTTKALELEAYYRKTGEKPINVAFLSGSQKFRVAVSLALGIGQYASRQHRPIESVIIDEGFGCLDSQGRQVMIQELQNLRTQMRCILLVSHQEDFAESFPDGYQFRLENGATRVTRYRK